MDTLHLQTPKPRMIAHRGLSGIELENTCSAFVAAGNRSYFGIETDVHVTADGQFIIIHDDSTKRVGLDDLTVENSTTKPCVPCACAIRTANGAGRIWCSPPWQNIFGSAKSMKRSACLN